MIATSAHSRKPKKRNVDTIFEAIWVCGKFENIINLLKFGVFLVSVYKFSHEIVIPNACYQNLINVSDM